MSTAKKRLAEPEMDPMEAPMVDPDLDGFSDPPPAKTSDVPTDWEQRGFDHSTALSFLALVAELTRCGNTLRSVHISPVESYPSAWLAEVDVSDATTRTLLTARAASPVLALVNVLERLIDARRLQKVPRLSGLETLVRRYES